MRWVRVEGSSLYPDYQAGDYVLIASLPWLWHGLKPGDVVVFNHPIHGQVIKKIEHLEDEGQSLFVVGLHPNSIDSRVYGVISRRLVLGKVIWHIPRP